MTDKGKLLLGIFDAFERSRFRYVLLPPYDGLPDNPLSDVDLCVPVGQVHAATALARRTAGDLGWQPVQTFLQPGGAICLVLWNKATEELLMLDTCGDYIERGLRALEASKLVASRRSHENLFVLAPGMAFAYLVVRGVLKGKDPGVCARALRAMFDLESEACETALREAFGSGARPSAAQICSNPEESWKKLRSFFEKNLQKPNGSALAELKRCIGRLRRPTGISVKFRECDLPYVQAAMPALKEGLRSCFRDVCIGEVCGPRKRLLEARSTLLLETSNNASAALDLSKEGPADSMRRHVLDLLRQRESIRYPDR